MAQHARAHLAQPGRRAALAAIAEGALDFEPAPLPAGALVIWGEKDGIVPPETALLDDLGPLGLLVPDAGHLPWLDDPDLVAQEIAAAVCRRS